MGIDAEIFVRGTITDDEILQAEAIVSAKIPAHMFWPTVKRPNLISRYWDHERNPIVELLILHRYFGPYYQRGDWPSIYKAIRAMQSAFPDRAVYYGGDNVEDHCEVTEDLLADLWALELGYIADDGSVVSQVTG